MRLIPALVPLLALAACTAADPPVMTPTPVSPAPTGAFDCGTHAIGQGDGLPEAAMRCVIDSAAQGRPARLQETRPTIEGDPIITWYVVRPDGVVQVTRDTTKDRFGTPRVTTEVCPGPVANHGMLTFARCDPS